MFKKGKNMGVPKIMPYCGCAATFFLHTLLTRWFHFENRGKRIIFRMHNFFTQFNFQFSFGIFFGEEVFLKTFLHNAYFGQNNLLVLFGDKIKLGRKCHHFIYSALHWGLKVHIF